MYVCMYIYILLFFQWVKKGVFVKGWFWRTCPRSAFRSGGTCEPTLVPVFVPGEHPNVPLFRFSFRGNIRQDHPFWKPPFCQPTIYIYIHTLYPCLLVGKHARVLGPRLSTFQKSDHGLNFVRLLGNMRSGLVVFLQA